MQPLTLPAGVVLQGVNGSGYCDAISTVPNVNPLSRLELKPGSTGPLISPDDGGTNLATHVHLFDLCLDCNGLAEPAIKLPDLNIPFPASGSSNGAASPTAVGGSRVLLSTSGVQHRLYDARLCYPDGTSGSPGRTRWRWLVRPRRLDGRLLHRLFSNVGLYIT